MKTEFTDDRHKLNLYFSTALTTGSPTSVHTKLGAVCHVRLFFVNFFEVIEQVDGIPSDTFVLKTLLAVFNVSLLQ